MRLQTRQMLSHKVRYGEIDDLIYLPIFPSILQTMKSESRYALLSVLIALSLLIGYSEFAYAQQIERIEVVEVLLAF